MELAALGEFGFLRRVSEQLACDDPRVIVGPGDDAAVVEAAPGVRLVITTDAMQDGVHFRLDWWRPADIGYRATAAALSDIAAMGAAPLAVVASWSAAPEMTVDAAEEMLAGVAQAARDVGAGLVGGDIAGAGRLWLALTAVGLQQGDRVLLRSGARPGDALLVTGTVGDSGVALALAAAGELRDGAASADHQHLLERHVRPQPRVGPGLVLARDLAVHAAIDLSDGLVQDAGHIAAGSGVGIRLRLDAVPLSEAARGLSPAGSDLDTRLAAMTSGEDYELLCAVEGSEAGRVAEHVERATQVPMTAVGEVVEGEGVSVIDETGAEIEVPSGGWDHFRG